MARVLEPTPELEGYGLELRSLLARANRAALATLERALAFVVRREPEEIPRDFDALETHSALEQPNDATLMAELLELVGRHSPGLRRALSNQDAGDGIAVRSTASPPVLATPV